MSYFEKLKRLIYYDEKNFEKITICPKIILKIIQIYRNYIYRKPSIKKILVLARTSICYINNIKIILNYVIFAASLFRLNNRLKID